MNLRAAIYGSDSNVYWSGFSTKLPSPTGRSFPVQ